MITVDKLYVFLFISTAVHLSSLCFLPKSFFTGTFKTRTTKITFIQEKQNQRVKINQKPPPNLTLKSPPAYIPVKNPLLETQKKDVFTQKLKPQETSKIKTEINLITPKDFPGPLPAYMGYYELIRNKIKNQAYQLYMSSAQGKMFLAFTLSEDGKITEVAIDREKSSPNTELKDIALASLEKAAPFPHFPAELKEFKTLAFKLYIVFKKDDS